MKTFFFLIAVSASLAIHAQQITKVSLQASGLTCSMCSNSINKALKTLDFVDKVNANIQTSYFEVSFKSDVEIDFNKLKRKVEDAGFSVSKFIAFINFNDVQVKNNETFTIGDKTFVFINAKEQSINGEKPVQVLDKGFVSAKQYKSHPLKQENEKTFHITI